MSPVVIFTQVLLPIAVLAWLAWYPSSGLLGYGLHVAATAAILLGLTLVGLWAFPPFWAPWFYGCQNRTTTRCMHANHPGFPAESGMTAVIAFDRKNMLSRLNQTIAIAISTKK